MGRNTRNNFKDNTSYNRDDENRDEREGNYGMGEYESTSRDENRNRQGRSSYELSFPDRYDRGLGRDYGFQGVRSNYGSQGRFDPGRPSYGREYQGGYGGINRSSRWQESQGQPGSRDFDYGQREGEYGSRQYGSPYGVGTEEGSVTRWQGESEDRSRSPYGPGVQEVYETDREDYGPRQGEYSSRRGEYGNRQGRSSYGLGTQGGYETGREGYGQRQGEYGSRQGRSPYWRGTQEGYEPGRGGYGQRQEDYGTRQGRSSYGQGSQGRYDIGREDLGQGSERRQGLERVGGYRQGSERRYETGREGSGLGRQEDQENRLGRSSRGQGQESRRNYNTQVQYGSPNYDSRELQRGFEEENNNYGRINEGFENTGNYGQRSESRGRREYSENDYDSDNIF